jgi:hypothetical protein
MLAVSGGIFTGNTAGISGGGIYGVYTGDGGNTINNNSPNDTAP